MGAAFFLGLLWDGAVRVGGPTWAYFGKLGSLIFAACC